jgi:hypothetical protein
MAAALAQVASPLVTRQDVFRAAMAPGIAKAKSICEAVAQELRGESAARVHDELVKRLQAEPFEWDDQQLQELSTSISGDSAGSEERDEQPSAAEGVTEDAPASEDKSQ